jgi:hypothetical protein
MSSQKRKNSADLITEGLTDIRTKFAKKTGWYIPALHDKYLRMKVGD